MLDLSYIGKWIHVQSYKHDGTLHRTWDSAMVVDTFWLLSTLLTVESVFSTKKSIVLEKCVFYIF